MISTWNLEYIFTIKFYIITNKTHNSAMNIFQVMPLFRLTFVLRKICTLVHNLKTTWDINLNSPSNSTSLPTRPITLLPIFFKLCPFFLIFCVKQNMHFAHNFRTTWDIAVKLEIFIHHQNLHHNQQDP